MRQHDQLGQKVKTVKGPCRNRELPNGEHVGAGRAICCAPSDPRFVGGTREDDEQKADHGYADTVVDPWGLAGHEAVGAIAEKAEALSQKAQSRDQSDDSDGSQQRMHFERESRISNEAKQVSLRNILCAIGVRFNSVCDERLTERASLQEFRRKASLAKLFRSPT